MRRTTRPPPVGIVAAGLPVRDRIECRSWTGSHQINNREQPNPDDVERVPEQGKAEQAALHAGAKVADRDLDHHHDEPDQPDRDVQSVTADKGKEGRQKGAALRGRAACDHAGELVQLETEEAGAEHESNRSPYIDTVAP